MLSRLYQVSIACRNDLGSEGNALYSVLSGLCLLFSLSPSILIGFPKETFDLKCNGHKIEQLNESQKL